MKNKNAKYYHGLRRVHTDFLKEWFPIGFHGIDYYNKNNIGIEFKESYMSNLGNMFFKAPLHQVELSDFFVFCKYNTEFFVVPSKDIKEKYSFSGKYKHACIRLNSIRKLAIRTFHSIDNLKHYLERLK